MASEARRHQLYEELKQVVSEDSADELMSYLPPVGWADVATRADISMIREEMDALRVEFRGELHNGLGELKREIGDVKGQIGDVKGQIGELKGEISDLSTRLDALTESVTALSSSVREFRAWRWQLLIAAIALIASFAVGAWFA